MIPEVQVSSNSNGTLLVVFTPSESTWKFPNGKKLKLFHLLHAQVTPQYANQFEEEDNLDFDEAVNRPVRKHISEEEVTENIRGILAEWIGTGDLIIE